MSKPVFPQVDMSTYQLPTPTMDAITAYVRERIPGASPEDIATAVSDYFVENPPAPTSLTVEWDGEKYPALPAERPAGLETVRFRGSPIPSSDTVDGGLPGWVGSDMQSILGNHLFWVAP